jgi:hypothetical protein
MNSATGGFILIIQKRVALIIFNTHEPFSGHFVAEDFHMRIGAGRSGGGAVFWCLGSCGSSHLQLH